LRLRSRSAGTRVAGWPGGAPSRAWAGRIQAGCRGSAGVVADTSRMRTAWAALDYGSDEQVSGAMSRPVPSGVWLELKVA
jgi:hypothetical protein